MKAGRVAASMSCGSNIPTPLDTCLLALGPDGTTIRTTGAGNQRPERQGRWEGKATEGSKGLTQEPGDTVSEENSREHRHEKSLLRVDSYPKTVREHSRSSRKWLEDGSRESLSFVNQPLLCKEYPGINKTLFPRRAKKYIYANTTKVPKFLFSKYNVWFYISKMEPK